MDATSRKIDEQAICMAATTLILAEGCTTVLMVQQFLRNKGYTTRQADVADSLHRVARQQRWLVDENALFRVYHFATARMSAQ